MNSRRARVKVPAQRESPPTKRTAKVRKAPQCSVSECCVCMEESPGAAIELSSATAEGPAETKVWCPCYEHAICKGCLHRIATSFGQSHPIGPEHPFVRCPYPFSTCASAEVPNYFPHASIERILTPDERERYVAHANRYQFPGFELVSCPRPLVSGGVCGAGILVDVEQIRRSQPGYVVMKCDQTTQCQRKSCYHCTALVSRSADVCDACITATENTNPNALNHYFYRPGKTASDGRPNLFRNEEVTADIAFKQIMEMIQSERLETKCTECLTVLMKTEQCNTLDHCGVERCYSCGRSGTRNQKLGDHWDSTGVKGCPRFDHSVYWNVVANCKFLCTEGENGCYGDQIGDCASPEHAAGIAAMIADRRTAHVYHALKSLLPHTRETTMALLAMEPPAREWLPKWKSSDYRTFIPLKVMQTLEKAIAIMAHAHDLPDVDRATWEFARDFVTKARQIVFERYPALPEEPKMKRSDAIFDRFRRQYAPRRAARA